MQCTLVFAGDDKVSFIALLYPRMYLHNFMSLILFFLQISFRVLWLKRTKRSPFRNDLLSYRVNFVSDLVNMKACLHLLSYFASNPQRPKNGAGYICRLILSILVRSGFYYY